MTKRKVNRLLAALLALTLTIGMLSLSVSAVEVNAAKIGSVEYATLQEAIDAATAGDTVVLMKDLYEEYVTVPKGTEIVLDLNGKSINVNNASWTSISDPTYGGRAVTNNGSLTVTDSTGDGSINCTAAANTAIFNNPGGVVVLDGDFTLTNVKSYVIVNHGTMTIENVTVDSKAFESSAVENGYNKIDDLAVYNAEELAALKCELTVNGGTFIGALNTFKNDTHGYLTINGGRIVNQINENADKHPSAILNWNYLVINNVDIDATDAVVLKTGAHKVIDGEEWRYEITKGETIINGGTFAGTNKMFQPYGLDVTEVMDCNNLNIKLNGGTYDVPLNEPGIGKLAVSGGKYKTDITGLSAIADGKTVKAFNGYYRVVNEVVAKIGDAEYTALQAAIDAAADADKIVLVEDIYNEYVTIPAEKNIELDLNGKSINVSEDTQAHRGKAIVNNGKLSLTDSIGGGSINCIADANKALVNNPGGEVVLDGNYTLTNVKSYAIENFGKMTIENVTVDSKAFGSSAVKNGYYSYDDLAGKTSEEIEALKAELTINGGTFIGAMNTIKNDSNGYMTINGGKIVNGINNGKDDAAILNWNVLVINDVEIDAKGPRVIKAGMHELKDGEEWKLSIEKGEMLINGGTFAGTGKMFTFYLRNRGSSSYNVDRLHFDIELKDGTFDAEMDLSDDGLPSPKGRFVMSGGDYKTDITGSAYSAYLAEGKMVEQVGNYYRVVDAPASYTVSGTAAFWKTGGNMVYALFDATAADEDIRDAWQGPDYTTLPGYIRNADATETVIDNVDVDGKTMSTQTFSFEGIAPGEYKLAIFKEGGYVPKIVAVTVGSKDVPLGTQKLWRYGDVNYDGSVDGTDAAQIQRYFANKAPNAWTIAQEEDKADMLLAADVNWNGEINGADASQVQRYYANKTPNAFELIK